MRSIYSRLLNFCLTSSAIGVLAGCSVEESVTPVPTAKSAVADRINVWTPMPGGAVEIAAGQNGKAWVLGTAIQGANGYQIYESSGGSWTFMPSPSGAARIYRPGSSGGSIPNQDPNQPWIIGNDGQAYRFTNGSWLAFGNISSVSTPLPFAIADMAYDRDPVSIDQEFFVLKGTPSSTGDLPLWRRTVVTNTWVDMGRGFKKIVYDGDYRRLLAISADTHIWSFDLATSTWTQTAGLAVDLTHNDNPAGTQPSVSTVGVIGVLPTSNGTGGNELFTDSGPLTPNWTWTQHADGAIRMAAGENGLIWIIKDDHTIWKGQL